MKEYTGDLLAYARSGQFDIIVQGCNCFCRMGAGIAKQIRDQYPQAFEADCATEPGDRSKLGTFTAAKAKNMVNGEFIIVNAYTQYGHDPKEKPLDYEALRKVFASIKEAFPGMRIGYPQIGAGLAGGDWEKITEIIDQELEGEDHGVVIYVPAGV